MRKIGLLAMMMFCIRLVYAQPVNDSSKVEGLRSFLQIQIGSSTGLEWNQKIGKKSVIDLFGGYTGGWAGTNSSFGLEPPFIFLPDAYVEYRNYYNLQHRMAQLKKTYNNSANFFFGRIETYFPVKYQNYFNWLLIQGWGVQRPLGKKIIANIHIGITEHFYYDKPPDGGFHYVVLQPFGAVSFSYIF